MLYNVYYKVEKTRVILQHESPAADLLLYIKKTNTDSPRRGYREYFILYENTVSSSVKRDKSEEIRRARCGGRPEEKSGIIVLFNFFSPLSVKT